MTAVALRFTAGALALFITAACGTTPAGQPGLETLRVCADPNNLPFSNEREEGFENALATLVAGSLGRDVAYTWWPQRRGFVRSTLNAGLCDVIMGVPAGFELALTTRPYYTSTYVFVTRRDAPVRPRSIDDPGLRTATLGLHIIGDDYAQVPPGAALVARGIISNVRGYSIYGDYSRPNPPADLIDAVTRGDVEIALAWGPLAGFFAARSDTPLAVTPIPPVLDTPMTFAIAMGVRRDDRQLRERLDNVIVQRAVEIRQLLERYHVPLVDDGLQAARQP